MTLASCHERGRNSKGEGSKGDHKWGAGERPRRGDFEVRPGRVNLQVETGKKVNRENQERGRPVWEPGVRIQKLCCRCREMSVGKH